MVNPLLSDRNIAFLLYELHDAEALCALPAYADHSRETFDLFLASVRKLARDELFPAYKPMDELGPRLENGRVKVHPAMRELWPRFGELGLAAAVLPAADGGQGLPLLVYTLATGYLMAANCGAYGYVGLTVGAAHLLHAFGDDYLKREVMPKLHEGRWSGTMCLTEPQAGSSLSDVQTRARPVAGGRYLIDGHKVFISGGDNDVTENVVHLVLARIEGAPAGIKGVSLFCVPRLRYDDGDAERGTGGDAERGTDGDAERGTDGDATSATAAGGRRSARLIDNDCTPTGVFHKMGWRGLPSIALNFGERGDCVGWLVGEPNRGISYMFQMMNEARLMVGMNGAATASAAYLEALEYAKTRPQGRPLDAKDPRTPQVPIIEHADVRRMLLRQKAIVEGSLALLATTSRYADLAAHAPDAEARHRAALLLDLLTPVAKSFPAEKGFESNALAIQVHGGYGYTGEYLPEAWLRDQKLNSLHEGTTGIQAMDLLGRKVVAEGGAALGALGQEVVATIQRAQAAGVPPSWGEALAATLTLVGELTLHLGTLGLAGEREAMLLHASDYLDLFSTVAIAWQWLAQAAAAREGLSREPATRDFYEGKLAAAAYWFATELPRAPQLAALCRSGEESFRAVTAAQL